MRQCDWDQVQYLCTGMVLKEFVFSGIFIFQWIRYLNFSFFFGWEIGHPLSTYATGGMEGVIQNVYRCVQGKDSWKIGHETHTY